MAHADNNGEQPHTVSFAIGNVCCVDLLKSQRAVDARELTPPSSSGLGHRPFTAAARVRIPLGVRSLAEKSTSCYQMAP